MQSQLTEVYSASLISEKVNRLAAEIDAFYGEESLLAVCVLKGAFIFFADLCRAIKNPALEQDFIRISSYGNGMETTRQLSFSKDLELSPEGRHVLLVEDIVDSGYTLDFLRKEMSRRNPLSLRVATLLDKKDRRELPVAADYHCFDAPDGFFVGYGLDYAEHYRALPGICALKL